MTLPILPPETLALAREYGFRETSPDWRDWRTGPGKFEGETVATVYYYDAMLNGDGEPVDCGEDTVADTFPITREDRAALPGFFDDGDEVVILHYFSSGFVSLEATTVEEMEGWRERIEDTDDYC